ncbi:hypothetical protein Pan258_10270 [Symmachiella dynata]|uniref:hypothetical protein n=1 Tax=Symmachiella dynata TaxID=2527995 RepID=UPI00118CE844|nr:hypothetical protein [Symmachiella dynata]QDT47000.1 hypothetical protein Pan258_10270 [Symmachiella dynata]
MRIRSLTTRMLFGALCCGVIAALPVNAFPQETPATEVADDSQPETSPAEEPTPDAEPNPAADWERLIYLPYKNLKQVFEKETATVFMPYSQYLKLWAGKTIPDDDSEKPPIEAVISRADYRGKVVNDLVKIEAVFTMQVLGKPWAEVPLKFGDAAVGKMTASNERILLRGTGEGTYALLLPEKGEHTVTLELVSRIRTSPDGRSFSLQCPTVGITNFDLEIPAADQTVEVTPHLVSTPIKSEGNLTRVQAGLGATKTISARWHPRVSSAPEMDLLASVENQLDIRVADGLIHTHAALAYKVLRGNLDQVRIAVPTGHRILDVSSPALKGWKAAKEQSGQVITVDLLPGKSRTITIEVHTERPVPDDIFSLAGIDPDGVNHGIHARGAVRESGLISVNHAADITLPIETQTGLTRIESAEIPKAMRRPGGMYFKFYTRDFDFQLRAKPVEPRITAVQNTRLEFRDDELHVDTSTIYTVERAGVFELRYQLPENFKVATVHCEQMEKYTVTEDTQELVVALSQKNMGQIYVVISGNVDFQAGKEKTELKLPVLTPIGTTRETGTVAVFAPEAIEIVTEEDAVIAAQPIRPRNIHPVPNMRLTAVWAYTQRPMEITVTTLRKPTRLTASVGTQVNIKQELVEVNALLHFDIQYAGIDTFVFAVPESVEDVQIENVDSGNGTAIKQRSRADEAEEGWVTWTVAMQRDVTGSQQFRIKYDLKPETEGTTATVLIEPPRILDVPANTSRGTAAVSPARVYGEVAVNKDRALSVAAATETLEAIDVRELKLLDQNTDLAYRYFKQPVEVQLTASKHEIQEVVETVVPRALIEAVTSTDAGTTYRCRYKITSSERQRLSIDLPAEAELLGVTVAGKRGSLERNAAGSPPAGWESYFVNVAREGSSEKPFHLMVLFRVERVNATFPQWGGPLSIDIPRIGGSNAVPVQQLRVAAWVPDEYALVGSPEQFSNDRQAFPNWNPAAIASTDNPNDLNTWIGGDSAGLFEFPISGHAYSYTNLGGTDRFTVTYWRSAMYMVVISGALFLVALLLSRTSWHNKLSVLVIGGFVLALLAVRFPNLAVHAFSSALLGIIAMAVLWCVHSLFRLRPHLPIGENVSQLAQPVSVATVVPPPGVFADWNANFRKRRD